MHTNDYYSIFRILECFWELAALDYPYTVIHKLALSLPASEMAQRVRVAVTLGLPLADTGKTSKTHRSSRPRARSASSSSSYSSGDRMERKLASARALMLQHDEGYAQHVERAKVIAHGRVFAVALQPALQAGLSGSIPSRIVHE